MAEKMGWDFSRTSQMFLGYRCTVTVGRTATMCPSGDHYKASVECPGTGCSVVIESTSEFHSEKRAIEELRVRVITHLSSKRGDKKHRNIV